MGRPRPDRRRAARGSGGRGFERELWSGDTLGEEAGFEQEIRLGQPESIQRLKLVFDTAAVPGWNEIDAVGLVDAKGKAHWAKEATASSSWKRGQDEPTAE